ncbi:MAG: phosphoglucomutase/phosphomannomutase PgmG [Alphaproteobacteria bacterium]
MSIEQFPYKEINDVIFREYDIRGIYNETLTDEYAYNIGKAFAILNVNEDKKLITVLRDGRLSSPSLSISLIKGLTDGGAEVIDIGVGPTPLLYFSNYNVENAIAGIMVTGSHNPSTHNGFKFMSNKKSFFGKDIQKIKETIQNDTSSFNSLGNVIEYDESIVRQKYIKTLLKAFTGGKRLKICWDPGNGATCDIIESLIKELPGEHIVINNLIDGTFPNHHPDPTIPENLEQLITIVKEQNCDLGIAFDGDGDRVGVVDDNGRIIWGDQLLSIYASYILKDNKDAIIIADVKASNNLFQIVEKLGGKAIMWKTGHSLIKSKMAETGALLAGEMSGHIFFADKYYGYDDAIYAAIRLIDLLANSNLSLSDLVDIMPKSFNTPEIRIDCTESYKFEAVNKIKELLNNANIEFNDIDGIRVNYPNGWWLVRASNTQAALVARCEANSEAELRDLKLELKSYLDKVGISIIF